jgi:hypothetical protein
MRWTAPAILTAILLGCDRKPPAPEKLPPAPSPAAVAESMASLGRILSDAGISTSTLKSFLNRDGKEVFTLTVHGSEAFDLWKRLRGLLDKTGRWPVILGEDEPRIFDDAEPIRTILAKADKTDAEAWLRKQPAENPEEEEHCHGPWPADVQPSHGFSAPFETLGGKARKAVKVALMPASRGWEVPAVLSYGDWNACPAPELHVAMLKRWNDLYGAELVSISFDIIETWLPRPPKDREAALALAREQFWYCGDIVTQGTGTIERLAATLIDSSTWYFWWD